MHCWKSINFEKQFGFERLFLLSLITGLSIFTLVYVPFTLLFSQTLYDTHFSLFFISVLLIYPLHKIFHLIPLLPVWKHVKIQWVWQLSFIPIIQIKVREPVPKNLYLSSIFSPMIVLNTLLIFACLHLPNYVHYFTIIMAYHWAICTTDVIYAKYLLFCPKNAMIEESDRGCEVLVCE
ncbi:DUF3267 domain-containing protein [Bacillus sp. 2205SS5-2]|uniref:DUF3267 domain-containing protein n=1 Tax=Bacillus sp. 2205SS5-2 TaxID=3109031 RepID=UPI003003B602